MVVTRSTSFPFCFDWTSDDTMLVTSRSGLDRLDVGGSLHPYADPGGTVLQRVALDRPAFSVALGGPHGTTLFMVANEWNGVEQIGNGPRTGVVYMTEVDVPAA